MTNLIHRFWGGEEMPEEYVRYGLKWRELNPDHVVLEWRFKNGELVCDHFKHTIINDEVWDSIFSPPPGMTLDLHAAWTQRADVLGYELLFEYGGWYFNTDIEPVQPLTELGCYDTLDILPAAAREDDDWLVNAAMWAPEHHHDFYRECCLRLPERYFAAPGEYMNVTTGPHLLTEVAGYLPIIALDKDAFSHVHWSQVPHGGDASFIFDEPYVLPSNTVGIHHWGHRKSQRSQTAWIG